MTSDLRLTRLSLNCHPGNLTAEIVRCGSNADSQTFAFFGTAIATPFLHAQPIV
jgi:hypothetical protein